MVGNKVGIFSVSSGIVDQLRCFTCKGFITSPDIFLLPDGNSLCHLCASEVPKKYKQVTLEAILKHALFRCRFAIYQCPYKEFLERLPAHEVNCDYRPIDCASLSNIVCKWRDRSKYFPYHVVMEHYDRTVKQGQFKFQPNEDSQGMIAVSSGNNVIVLKYCYVAATYLLSFVTAHFGPEGGESFTISLFKDEDIKGWKSVDRMRSYKFNPAFFNMEYAFVWELVKISDAKYVRALIFPEPSGSDLEIIGPTITPQKYPCRWRNCVFEEIRSCVRVHEAICPHRSYSCMYPNCKASLNFSSVSLHMHEHKCISIEDKYVYRTSFAAGSNKEHIYLFQVKDFEIFLIKAYLISNVYYIQYQSSCFEHSLVSAFVKFEHDHFSEEHKTCMRTFDVVENLEIKLSELSDCYLKTNELTIAVGFKYSHAVDP